MSAETVIVVRLRVDERDRRALAHHNGRPGQKLATDDDIVAWAATELQSALDSIVTDYEDARGGHGRGGHG